MTAMSGSMDMCTLWMTIVIGVCVLHSVRGDANQDYRDYMSTVDSSTASYHVTCFIQSNEQVAQDTHITSSLENLRGILLAEDMKETIVEGVSNSEIISFVSSNPSYVDVNDFISENSGFLTSRQRTNLEECAAMKQASAQSGTIDPESEDEAAKIEAYLKRDALIQTYFDQVQQRYMQAGIDISANSGNQPTQTQEQIEHVQKLNVLGQQWSQTWLENMNRLRQSRGLPPLE